MYPVCQIKLPSLQSMGRSTSTNITISSTFYRCTLDVSIKAGWLSGFWAATLLKRTWESSFQFQAGAIFVILMES